MVFQYSGIKLSNLSVFFVILILLSKDFAKIVEPLLVRMCPKTVISSSSSGTLIPEYTTTIRNVNNGNSKVNARANCELRYGTGRACTCL